MNYAIAALFVFAGLINFAPVLGAVGIDQLNRAYQVAIDHADVALLMQHRAVLFGIVGGLIIAAAFIPNLRSSATAAGLVSMVSFMVLVFFHSTENSALIRIAWIDAVATAALIAGYALHLNFMR